MGVLSSVRSAVAVGLLSALSWALCLGGESSTWSWDSLSSEILPKVASQIDDFGSIVRVAQAASCTVDVSISSNANPFPVTGRLRYSWKDEEGRGVLDLDEVSATVDSAAGPGADATMFQIRDQLEVQTVTSVASLFFLHKVKTQGKAGGYEMTIEPVGDKRIRERLGYSRIVISLDKDCLPRTLDARMLDGTQVTAKPKYTKRGLRWLSTGYNRVILSGAGRIEESRSDEYTVVDGVTVLSRATIQSSWATFAGIVRTEQSYTFSNWKIERRKEAPKKEAGTKGEGKESRPPQGSYVHKRTVKAHEKWITAAAISADGARFATCGEDPIIRVWDPAAENLLKEWVGARSSLRHLAFSPDGKRIASGADAKDGGLRIWEAETGKEIQVLDGVPAQVTGLAWSSDGRRIVAAGFGGPAGDGTTLLIWDGGTGAVLAPLKAHADRIIEIAFCPAQPGQGEAFKLLTSAGKDKRVKVWDLDAAREISSFATDEDADHIAISSDGTMVAASGDGAQISIWNVGVEKPARILTPDTGPTTCIAFSPRPGSRMLVSGDRQGAIRIWDAGDGTCIQTIKGRGERIEWVAVSRDERSIVSTGSDGAMRTWSREAETPIAIEPKTEPGFVPAAEIAPPDGGDEDLARAVIHEIERKYLAPWPQDIIFFAEFSLADHEGKPLDILLAEFATNPHPAPAERRPKTDFPDREEASELAGKWLSLVLSSPLESVHEETRQRKFRAWKRGDGHELMEGARGKYFDRILVGEDDEIRRREGWTALVDAPSPVIVHEYETETEDDVKYIRRIVERHLDEKTGAVLLERTARFAYEEEFEGKPFVSSVVFTFDGKELTVKTESVD